MCGCSCSYNCNKLNRPCCKCDVRGTDAGNPLIECKRISMLKIATWINDENKKTHLAAYNQLDIDTIFFKLNYGGCKYGMFSAACPVEPLHAIEKGLFEKIIHILFNEEMTNRQRAGLDAAVRKLCYLSCQKGLSSGADKDFPRLLWLDGITTLSKLTGKDMVGIIFTVVSVSLTSEG